MAKRKNPPQLAKEHAIAFAKKCDWEGDLLYVVENWDFKEFRDKKFNSLRKAFIEAARKFKDYTGIDEVDLCDDCPGKLAGHDGTDKEICDGCGDTLEDNGACPTCTEAV